MSKTPIFSLLIISSNGKKKSKLVYPFLKKNFNPGDFLVFNYYLQGVQALDRHF